MSNVRTAVIIPTLPKNREYLRLCVESLRATVDWDIIVVSNGTDVRPDYSDVHGITQHIHTPDQGQCIATNLGAEFVDAGVEYLMVTNDDMYYAPGWNRNLHVNEETGLVFSPNLVEPTNNAGSAPPFLKADGGFTLDEFKRDVVDAFIDEQVEATPPKLQETGFNLPFFIKKKVWDRIGGYDVAYDPWGSNSDTDLQAKIHIAGIQTIRLRDVLVYHFSNKSGTFDGTHQAEWQRNFDYFTEKFGFNRDTVPGCDVWYSKNILPEDDAAIKYRPIWKGEYADS